MTLPEPSKQVANTGGARKRGAGCLWGGNFKNPCLDPADRQANAIGATKGDSGDGCILVLLPEPSKQPQMPLGLGRELGMEGGWRHGRGVLGAKEKVSLFCTDQRKPVTVTAMCLKVKQLHSKRILMGRLVHQCVLSLRSRGSNKHGANSPLDAALWCILHISFFSLLLLTVSGSCTVFDTDKSCTFAAATLTNPVPLLVHPPPIPPSLNLPTNFASYVAHLTQIFTIFPFVPYSR